LTYKGLSGRKRIKEKGVRETNRDAEMHWAGEERRERKKENIERKKRTREGNYETGFGRSGLRFVMKYQTRS
jgi:hypothetical protein